MGFIDGENFAIRAKAFAAREGLALVAGPLYEPDVFVWMPDIESLRFASGTAEFELRRRATRCHYYTSVHGDAVRVAAVTYALRNLRFHPCVFKRPRGREKAKGVDIALTNDMLANAFRDNYDVAVLVAGDGDYVPLVEEVKRLGKNVYVTFFDDGLSPRLELSADLAPSIDALFRKAWSPGDQDNSTSGES